MEKLIDKGSLYADFHQQSVSFYTHLIAFPLIYLSLMIFLNFFHLIVPGVFDTTLAELGTLALIIYYIRMQWQLGLLLLPFLALLLWFGSLIGYHGPSHFAIWSFFTLIVLGFVSQLVGCFLTNTRFSLNSLKRLLLAPLYLMAELCYRTGFLIQLNEKLHGKDTAETLTDASKDDLL